MNNKIAVIAAHPDDEVLGCGGSLARLSRSGASVHIFILATGLTSRGPANRAALSALKDQARAAAARLGAATIDFADFPDNAMWAQPSSVMIFLVSMSSNWLYVSGVLHA